METINERLQQLVSEGFEQAELAVLKSLKHLDTEGRLDALAVVDAMGVARSKVIHSLDILIEEQTNGRR